jgi:hypothetical protein
MPHGLSESTQMVCDRHVTSVVATGAAAARPPRRRIGERSERTLWQCMLGKLVCTNSK